MVQQAETFLRIAKNHIGYIKRAKKESWQKGAKHHDHSVVVIIMSAAAVESIINHMLVAPTLFIPERRIRIYFGNLITKVFKASIHSKIKFIIESYNLPKISSKIKKDIQELVEIRNKIIHSTPIFAEQHYLPDSWENWDNPVDINDLPTKPGLLINSIDSELINKSVLLYESAKKFVEIIQNTHKIPFSKWLKDVPHIEYDE